MSTCILSAAEIERIRRSGAEVELVRFCDGGGANACIKPCDAGAEPGTRYQVIVNGELAGRSCLVSADPTEEVAPGRVLRAFQRLEWPKSELIVQPPDGRTLVNFDTNFLTENTESTRQTVTLLGQRVVIEAEPTSYVWSFGDGESLTTESPGARYPELVVTHQYLEKATYRPRVDTVYTGRYRVNGGPWVQIPETLTVEGYAQQLEAIEATPLLVAPDGG